MSSNLLNLFSLQTPTPTPSSVSSALSGSPLGGASKSAGSNIGDLMFGQLLTAQLQNSKSSSLGSAGSGLSAMSSQLQTLVAQLLQNGYSLEQIAKQLGATLGSNLLAQLQLQTGLNPNANLRNALAQMIAQALGPPANGPPLTAAQAASAFVQRLGQVADALTKVGANAAGQQQDSLGSISDANAGDTPAPNKTAGILQAALAALQQFSSNLTAQSASSTTAQAQGGSQAPVPPPAPWIPTTTSTAATAGTDPNAASAAQLQNIAQNTGGPTVATNPALTLVGTGADTVIGRILARAANVAADQAQNANAGSATTQNATSTLQPQIAVTATASASSANDSLAAAVLRSLQTALASLPPVKTDPSATADASNVGVSSAAPTTTLLGNMSLGISPIVSTVSNNNTTTTPSQTPQAPQPPVDPNAVVDQVLQGISMRTMADGSQTVRMRLVPESLGNVTVSLQVSNGSVNATLLAQNTDVRDALLANQQMLARSLADAGLKLTNFTVNLANQGQYQQQQTAYQQRFGTTRRFVGVTSSADEDAITAVPSYGLPSTQLAALQWLNALA